MTKRKFLKVLCHSVTHPVDGESIEYGCNIAAAQG